MHMRDRFLVRLVLLGLAVFLAVGLWRSLSGTGSWFGGRDPDAAPRAVLARGDLAADELSTIELFERARDSVVFISTSRQVQDFWTRNVFSVPRGSGSGFIWDDAGHVVTNFHVIQGASEATVRLADGRDYKASLAGVSPVHDIAVLRIGVDFKRPPPVPVGTSEDLKVGQKVFAIGNPFGLDWTLTTGIVSALDRSLPSDSGQTIEHLIQTDAAINPGSSGGPLLDSAGRLIGINTAIFSTTGESVGIGFAVPVDTVNRVVPELIRQGRYVRPVLGIDIDERINRRIVAMLRTEGVFVLRVTPGSAAEASGLRGARIDDDGSFVQGDVIVGVAGRRIASVGELLGRLDEYRAGEPVSLNVLRDGGEIEVVVILQPGT
jgi:S1-C subfamily serine protease